MKIIDTSKLTPRSLKPQERAWVYNGLDACVTYEVLDVLLPQLDKVRSRTYDFSRDLQGPVLDMRIHGVKVDMARRAEVTEQYYQDLDRLETNLERIVREGFDFIGFNWRSPPDLRTLFYDICRIPTIFTKAGRPTVNRAALEKMEAYTIAQPIIKHMKAMRDIKKRLDVLKTEIDHDGRIRTSYNIAGTNTGRFSSSFSEFGTGGNLQNIEESLRSIFIADDGMKLANFDAEQGESRCVGAVEWNLFRKSEYLDTCESKDMHLAVAQMCGLGPDSRQMCKVLGHGTNYGGKPQTMTSHTGIKLPVIVDFQHKYFRAFPAHQMWHAWVEEQIRSYGWIINLAGRKRHFFGRRDSPDVIREAIAYDPQGSLSDIVNQGMLNVWKANDCQLLMQIHDSIVVQYPEEQEDEIIPKILKQLHNEIPLKHNRTLMIPYGCKTGWNWGDYSQENPDGLKSYKPGDKRARTPKVHILDRKLRRTYI